jgi:hypothetical protein
MLENFGILIYLMESWTRVSEYLILYWSLIQNDFKFLAYPSTTELGEL